MSGYIKYFDDCGKNMSFKTKDDNIFLKYNKIWNKIKKALNIKFKYSLFQTINFHLYCIFHLNSISAMKAEKKLSSSLSRKIQV